MAKPPTSHLAVFLGLSGFLGFSGAGRADDGKDNAGQVWAKDEAPEEEPEDREARLGSPQVRATKKWGVGLRYGHVFFDPHALGLEAFANYRPPNFQLGADLQAASENLVDSMDEEPMTSVSTLKLQRQQIVFFARYFFLPELYGTAGLGYRQTTVVWEEHERLGTGTAEGKAKSTAMLLDLRVGHQWSFRQGWYLTLEAGEYTAPFAAKTRHSVSRGGARSAEVDERIQSLKDRSAMEGKKPNWELINLCAGRMF